jgi:hypothetical protein
MKPLWALAAVVALAVPSSAAPPDPASAAAAGYQQLLGLRLSGTLKPDAKALATCAPPYVHMISGTIWHSFLVSCRNKKVCPAGEIGGPCEYTFAEATEKQLAAAHLGIVGGSLVDLLESYADKKHPELTQAAIDLAIARAIADGKSKADLQDAGKRVGALKRD